MNYPSPCEKCTYAGPCNAKQGGAYQMFIRSWWKHFNGLYIKLCAHKGASQKFVYLHPDEYRRYIEKSPCESCKAHEKCTTPCATYWKWWDERMEWHRRRLS